MDEPVLIYLSCGGTIAMERRPDRLLRPSAPDSLDTQIQQLVPGPVSHHAVMNVDSSQMDPIHWAPLIRIVRKQAADHPGVPILISHGTDSMEWTAGALAVAVEGARVVLTGSRIPYGEPDSDAPTQLDAAVHFALSDTDPGICLCWVQPNGLVEVFQGGFFRKAPEQARTFVGIPAPLKRFDGAAWAPNIKRQAVQWSVREPNFGRRVLLVPPYPVADRGFYDEVVDRRAVSTLLLQTYPSGCPPWMVRLTHLARAADIDVHGVPLSAAAGTYPSFQELVQAGAQWHPATTPQLLYPYLCSADSGAAQSRR